jgi:hypothetical protein
LTTTGRLLSNATPPPKTPSNVVIEPLAAILPAEEAAPTSFQWTTTATADFESVTSSFGKRQAEDPLRNNYREILKLFMIWKYELHRQINCMPVV